jgi:hypothetical protein
VEDEEMSEGEESEDEMDDEGDEKHKRNVFALTADEGVRKKLRDMESRMEDQKKTRTWKDGVRKMHEALAQEGVGSPVMEIFSPSRVNGMAARLGIVPGMSLDLTTNDPDDGRPWDFSDPNKRKKALDKVLAKEALLVIGSPLCKSFSNLQNWNFKRMDPEKVKRMKKEGMDHLKFCMMLYRIQVENGMYFLHEHPPSIGQKLG